MTEIVTQFRDGEEVIITTIQKHKTRVPYFLAMVKEKKVMDTMNVVHTAMNQLAKMSRSASWLMWELMNNRNNQNNMAVFRADGNVESKKVTKAYKELYALGLVKRVKRQHYLINPDAFLPLFDEYPAVCRVWKEVK